MAVTVTIDTPTVLADTDHYVVSVVSHFANSGVQYEDKIFSTTLHTDASAERVACINGLATQINAHKAILTKQVAASSLMTALKAAIEAKI